MTTLRKVALGSMVLWTVLVVGTAALPAGTFPNSIEPRIAAAPFSYVWLLALSAAWFLILPALLKDSDVPE